MPEFVNKSEEFAYRICKDTFLSIWSYLNPKGKKGKELCDILVVCDPHIIIFSVKEILLKNEEPAVHEIKRWSNKAIDASAKQIFGAERFLETAESVIKHDGNVGLRLPPIGKRVVHRVAIAFGGKGKAYIHSGDFDKGFVHVFDETSFEIILQELDTITDFIEYLNAKRDSLSLVY